MKAIVFTERVVQSTSSEQCLRKRRKTWRDRLRSKAETPRSSDGGKSGKQGWLITSDISKSLRRKKKEGPKGLVVGFNN